MRGRYFKRRDARAPRRQRQKGAALVLVAGCLVVMLGVLGLAIDSSLAYLSKARLSLAADSAVLAAADSYMRGTGKGTDPAQRAGDASSVADAYFLANYPGSFLGKHVKTHGLYSPNPLDPPFIRYDANAEYPQTFSKVISSDVLKVATAPVVTFKNSSPRHLALAIVIDSSDLMYGFSKKYGVISAIMDKYVNKLDANTTRVSIIFAGDSRTGHSSSRIPEGGSVAVEFRLIKAGFDVNKVRLALLNNTVMGAVTDQGGIRLAIDELKKVKKYSDDDPRLAIFYIGLTSPDRSVFKGGESPQQELVNVAREAHQNDISMYVLGWESAPWGATPLLTPIDHYSIDGKSVAWAANDLLTCVAGDPRLPTPTNCPIPTSAGNRRCSAVARTDDLSGFEACLPDASGSGPGPALTQAVLTQ